MPYKTELSVFIADWWGFGAFLVGALVAFIAGRERQRYQVDAIGREVAAQSKRIERLESQGNYEAVRLGEIITTQNYIKETLIEIKQAMGGKADK